MPDRLERIEATLQELDATVSRITARLDALERQAPREPAGAQGSHPQEPIALLPFTGADMASSLSLTGRTFIVLGGAFLLRALTESARVPSRLGVALGLVYAVTWLGACDRAASRSRAQSALFHGVTGVLLSLPLLWESSTRFRVLTPTTSAAAMALLAAIALAVAARQRLRTLAAVAVLGTLAIATPLAVVTGQMAPFAVLLVGLGAVTLGIGYRRGWAWLGWPAAIVADAFLFVLIARVAGREPPTTPAVALALDAALFVVYLGFFAVRTLAQGHAVTIFEVLQSAGALAVGLGGVVSLAGAAGIGLWTPGVASLALAILAYLTAFRVVAPRQGVGRNFHFYATLGLVLTLVSARLMLAGPALPLSLAGLALLATSLGRRPAAPALAFHGVVYAVAAMVVSGWTSITATAWLGVPAGWPQVGGAAVVALAAAWLGLVARPLAPSATTRFTDVTRVTLAVIVVLASSAAVLTLVGPRIAGTPADAGMLATLRTAVLTVGAILAALVAWRGYVPELGPLVYPILLCGGIKLVLEDFTHSRPATLFLALALYGAALLATPRLSKRR
jgi:hypothetical protein